MEALGNTTLVRPHAGALNGIQIYIGNGSFLYRAIEVWAGPIDWLSRVIAQDVFERFVPIAGLVRAKNWGAIAIVDYVLGLRPHR
jgi:hypothetical protein